MTSEPFRAANFYDVGVSWLSTDAPASWKADAACKGHDPNLFFPHRGEDTTFARSICGGCPVQEECAEHAIDHGERVGIWGGLSERERRRQRRARRHAA